MCNPIIEAAELVRNETTEDKAFRVLESLCNEITGDCDYENLKILCDKGADVLLERANKLLSSKKIEG